MPEFVSQILETNGLIWLVAAFATAGVVRGFTGFGTAMIVVPIGAMFLSVAEMVFLLTVTGLATSATLFPKAWPKAEKTDILVLCLGAVITMPLGVSLLVVLDDATLRWAVIAVIVTLLACLLTGWRYSGSLGRTGLALVGASAGIVGGASGLTGPVVILFYLAGRGAVETIRANTILFLGFIDFAIVANLVWRDLANWTLFGLVVVMSVPYVLTTLIGQRFFDPKLDRVYRSVAYCVIGAAAFMSMPVFD